jgi:hypothetical protein
MRKLINTITCLCVIAACGTAFAQKGEKMMSGPYKGPMGPVSAAAPDAPDAIFFSNLVANPCQPGFKYDTSNGFLVLGPTNCFLAGTTQWLAAPFVAKGSGAVTKVTLAVTQDTGLCTGTSNKFTVQIYDDGAGNGCTTGLPQNPLGTPIVATAPAAPPALANANFGATGPLLTNGVRYWVVVTTSTAANQMGTTAVWWEATGAFEPFNLNDGNGWNAGPLGGVGGFQVQ